jgi:hypothetical protein
MKFRDLKADEIDIRVQSVKADKDGNPKGVILLLYKNARCDMNILDETVGAENWQREHYECKGNLFCRVGIKCGDTYVWKSDCGSESNTEAEKGEASDSFKRACFNWGIGRELYTSPFIWIPANLCKKIMPSGKDKYGKPSFACGDKFGVAKIAIKDKKITELAVYSETPTNICFTFGQVQAAPKRTAQPKQATPAAAAAPADPSDAPFDPADMQPQMATKEQCEYITKVYGDRLGDFLKWARVDTMDKLSYSVAARAVDMLAKRAANASA